MRLEATGEALTPAEQQEEGRRQLAAIQRVGWKWSCAIPGVSGRHSLSLLRGEKSEFPFSSAGVEPGSGCLTQRCVRGQVKRGHVLAIQILPWLIQGFNGLFLVDLEFGDVLFVSLIDSHAVCFPTAVGFFMIFVVSALAIKYKR